VTFVPTRSTDDSRNGGIAEFSIITKWLLMIFLDNY
jgi:hypothetical protein